LHQNNPFSATPLYCLILLYLLAKEKFDELRLRFYYKTGFIGYFVKSNMP